MSGIFFCSPSTTKNWTKTKNKTIFTDTLFITLKNKGDSIT